MILEPQDCGNQEHGALVVGFKAGQSADGGLGYEEEKAPTLSGQPSALEPTLMVAAGFDGQMGAKAQGIGYAEEQVPTLKSGGWNGCSDTVGALCADDFKGPNRQYVDQGKLVWKTEYLY